MNCAAIPDSLLESELFGHTRGAFTGAVQSQVGRFSAAQGGTLFLDEVAELPLSVQPKLLRFLEEKEIQRLGSPEVIHVDTRVVAATNADLTDYLATQRLRRDLFYRISGFRIDLPPLRSRGDDILRLARHFLLRLAQSTRTRPLDLSPAAVQRLVAHGWEGNVRELQLVLEQASILAGDSAQVQPEHIRFALPARVQSRAEAA